MLSGSYFALFRDSMDSGSKSVIGSSNDRTVDNVGAGTELLDGDAPVTGSGGGAGK